MAGLIVTLISFTQQTINIPKLAEVQAETTKKNKQIEAPRASKDTKIVKHTPIAEEAPRVTLDMSNEAISWRFFIQHGYTANQTAGILGNLQQEHKFNTSDVPSGLGIAQWLGNRRSNLIARGNYTDINVQLQFMLDELNSTESRADSAIKSSISVEQSTIAFQNLYERCGVCVQGRRISYSYDMLNRFK